MLNEKLINRCNDLSFFNSGNVIKREYESRVSYFKNKYNNFEGYEPQQQEYLKEREKEWQTFLIDLYNTFLQKRADFTPWFISGRANYNVARENKKLERLENFKREILPSEIEKFIYKTNKTLKKLTSIESELKKYRETGDGYPIVMGSPYAKEKIKAKLEYHKELHDLMKRCNAYFRKHKSLDGFDFESVPQYMRGYIYENLEGGFQSFYLTNNNAEIKRLEARLKKIEANENKETQEKTKSWGKIVYNTEIERIQLIFDEKPSREIIDLLKSKGFRWSPKNKAWQRMLNSNAEWALKELLKHELFSE